jgi:hypothetical protein
MKMAVFWVAASIIRVMSALMMEAASTADSSVNFYNTTQCSNPEDFLFQCGGRSAQEDKS